MRMRTYLMILLFGAWPQLGCHQLPADKSVQDLRPIQQQPGAEKKQALTAADITQTWVAKAEKLEKEGKTSEAIAVCEKMREPGSSQAVQATKKIALIYARTHDLDKAEQEYQRILLQNPQNADALYGLGDISYQRGHMGIAEKHFRAALAQKPDHMVARASLGMTLAQQGYYAASVEEFMKVSSKAEAYCEVAFIMKLQGKVRDAVVAYETALKIEAGMPRATMELAKIRQTLRTDPPTKVTLTTPYGPSGIGMAEVETPTPTLEGTGRQAIQRPTLPPLPLPDFDVPVDGGRSKKK